MSGGEEILMILLIWYNIMFLKFLLTKMLHLMELGWGHSIVNYSGHQTHSLIRRFKNVMDFFLLNIDLVEQTFTEIV